MKQITAEDVRLLQKETGEGMMVYTQEQYAELENRCNGWRKLCYKHEQTICDLKYQIVVLESVTKDKTNLCPVCNGTGIESYYNHGHGEDSVEPIKCEECDGFGRQHEQSSS